jgi:DNA-directed RNA polymerase I, II, and III subunit RPABC2
METEEYVDVKDPEAAVEDGPEEAEDTGELTGPTGTADALGITEAPSIKTQALLDQHPEIMPDYEEEVLNLLVIKGAYPPTKERDPNHCTYPFLTLYERTKILSLRASHLAHGDAPYMEIPDYLTDVYEIAKAELEAKRLPYIVKRPLPDGNYEYWRLADLMLL